ncbi:hypothetical protein BD410DRAFT_288053 [Rickenella mellea]|uniref:Mixed lineage kinase domain-containing protein n=1 Tax=Rickenella mellea TaxID=50990 RepID=A0A4Y7Q3C1_9AGAM|nr:hypothetical protein BD410DRAFT_288053 [Rickenella mellea]
MIVIHLSWDHCTADFHTASRMPVSKRTTVEVLVSNSITALDLAKELAPLIPVPFVASIFASARVIVDAVQNVRQNKLACAELGKRVADLAVEIGRQIRGHEDLVDHRLEEALGQLQQRLNEISTFMDEQASLGVVSRVVRRGNVSTQVLELTSKLDYAMQTFKTMSTVRLELHIGKMQKQLATLNERAQNDRLWDGHVQDIAAASRIFC